MKRLSKEQDRQRAELVAFVEKARDSLEQQVEQYNQVVREAFSKVEASVAALNSALEDLNAFVEEVVGGMDDYLSERTEKWLDSEAGQNYTAWKEEWQNAKLEDVSIEEPIEVEMPDVPVEQICELPDTPG